jgi:uncharacterized protein (DUF1810 family)
MENELNRFLAAQERDYSTALAEIRRGRKRSHWMWYIFPQIQGLGHSSTAQFYAIRDLQEATAYLAHETLGRRLVEISKALLSLPTSDPTEIFGSPDDLKLRSSITLFSGVPGSDPVFSQVLDKFFGGQKDNKTVSILKGA